MLARTTAMSVCATMTTKRRRPWLRHMMLSMMLFDDSDHDNQTRDSDEGGSYGDGLHSRHAHSDDDQCDSVINSD